MADEEKQDVVVQGATSPIADEDVKMEDEGNDNDMENEQEDAEDSGDAKLSRDHYNAMRNVVEIVNTHKVTIRGEEHYPAQLFRRVVNKRLMPDYYEVIKEPTALSTVKQKLLRKQYTEIPQFVRDFAQIVHNAKLYNRPNSGAYNDALAFEEVFKNELDKLVETGLITKEETEFPYLGEIPEATPEPDLPEEEEEAEEEGDDDEDDEDDEAEDSDEDRPGRRGRRGRKSAGGRKRDEDDKAGETDTRKRRGRPPRVDTPMEARIKAVLKGIRKFKDEKGMMKVSYFERLPDKVANPEYFTAVPNPIAIDLIKRKAKRKKYTNLDDFMRDMDLMFNNAKMYNENWSEVYKAAADLQYHAQKIMDEEKNKPDSELAGEDGRFPLPQGILHNNEVYKVGDWVHIQNPNDVTKPIVAQIYRTWQDTDKQMWINACWYYRPEQTVHQYEKHFFPHEVVKTGQYRDHHIDEVVDRCFVMFFTRYNRGRPRGLDPDREVYVCEARYNEEKHKLNKIKTWASCLPDEVREVDYEMDMFDVPRKIKKVPSPLLHLLKDDTKEVKSPSDIPSPKWGATNAPPIVGAIYKGLRDENQSPPPSPTPPPPPTPPPAPSRQLSHPSQQLHRPSIDAQGDINMDGMHRRPSMASASPAAQPAQYPGQQPPTHAPSASPAPMFQRSESFSRQQPGPFTPQTPSQNVGHGTPAAYNAYAYNANNPPQMQAHRPPTMPQASPALGPGYGASNTRGIETYVMPDTANAAIPLEIRQQFQTDEQGRVLFFTAPPLDRLPLVQPETGSTLSHSADYLAKKLQKETAALEAQSKTDGGKVLSLKQKRFLELAHQADAREQATAARGEAPPASPKDIMTTLQNQHDAWMRSYFSLSKNAGDDGSYEDYVAREQKLAEIRREKENADEAARQQILSQCEGITASRASADGQAIESARKRLCESDCRLEEKVKLRRMIAEHERKTRTKPVYLDDYDARYGPM